MRSPSHLVLTLAFTLGALEGPAAALAEPLPLAHGIYVEAGTPCADPPFAVMRSYDGVGLGDPHSHACRIRVLARHGAHYMLANSCIGVGVGPGTRSTETLRLMVRSRRAFAISGSTFRLCPAKVTPWAPGRRPPRG
ncbi:hypothetical protein [Sphingomonas sp. CROZ-RG-20F-R02-07]|uniref:hypothetical protein n=1 Tax=Sphingomonas sp. CROZ-RG-20F-R02-07 TaxID=2914832 RepID=UPI001F594C72|nr:hypothetical protein [Sphingomonas sp. CROZ-RG-20F-R02-07]